MYRRLPLRRVRTVGSADKLFGFVEPFISPPPPPLLALPFIELLYKEDDGP